MDQVADKSIPSGNDGKASGEADSQNPTQVTSIEEQKVAHSSYVKAVEEAKVAKRKLREFEEAKLRQENDLKGLLEIKEKELSEFRAWKSDFDQRELSNSKVNALKSAFKTKIDDKWLKVADLNNIRIDESSGTIDPRSVEIEARRLEMQWPEAFQKPVPGAQTNSPAAVGGVKQGLSYQEWNALPSAEEKKKRFKELDLTTMR